MAMTMEKVILKARSDLNKLTGLEPSTTVKTARDDKGWHVSVEMVEKHSIPDGMDILATYDTLFDDEGNLLEFIRKGMRKRVDTISEG